MKLTYFFVFFIFIFFSLEVSGQCTDPTVYWRDADGDGFGNPDFLTNDIDEAKRQFNATGQTGYSGNIVYGCNVSGYVTPSSQATDRDDSNALITDVAPRNFYYDNDRDGYGDPSISVYQSHAPSNYVAEGGDCNDTDQTPTGSVFSELDFDLAVTTRTDHDGAGDVELSVLGVDLKLAKDKDVSKSTVCRMKFSV